MKDFLAQYFSIVKRLIPEPRQSSFVGLDIGGQSCKFVEVKKEGNSFFVLNFGEEPIGPNNTSQAIHNIMQKVTVPNVSPATSVLGKGTIIRYIEMPRMSLEELKKSFSIEADKYFPFPKDEIYMDCCILDPKSDHNKMFIMMAASKKELVDQRIEILKTAGLEPSFVGINSIAIANVFNVLTPDNSTDNAVAVLDIGEKVSNLTIMVKNVPRFTRDIFIGGSEFTKSISNSLGISFDKAELLKCEAGEQVSEVLKASDSEIFNLITELRLSFDYFVTEMNSPIEQVFLTGGSSCFNGLSDMFTEYLDIPVALWDPFEYLELGECVSKEDLKNKSSKLTVALGLALQQQG